MKKSWIYSFSFVLAGAGFLLPFWPLSVAGILLAALAGRWIFAVCVGLLLDVAWGMPTGVLHYLLLPFTFLALLAALGRYLFAGYFLDRGGTDTL